MKVSDGDDNEELKNDDMITTVKIKIKFYC